MSKRRDLYQEVTDQIVAELEAGTAPWVRPWKSTAGLATIPHNAATKRPYNGTNILLLWLTASARGYTCPAYCTFKQIKDAGGIVRKGEHGTTIIYVHRGEREVERDDGTTEMQGYSWLKAFTVFNLDQCDGVPQSWIPEQIDRQPMSDGPFKDYVQRTGADVRVTGNEAFYVPSADYIQVPQELDFLTDGHFKTVLLHELGHWTGHKSRLDRDLRNRFGTKSYAAEELIAELTAAFMCANLGIQGDLRHATYIETWIKLLRSDKKAIFTAASAASKAADYLMQFAEDVQLSQAA